MLSPGEPSSFFPEKESSFQMKAFVQAGKQIGCGVLIYVSLYTAYEIYLNGEVLTRYSW